MASALAGGDSGTSSAYSAASTSTNAVAVDPNSFPSEYDDGQRAWLALASTRVGRAASQKLRQALKDGDISFYATVELNDEHEVFGSDEDGLAGRSAEALDTLGVEAQALLDQELHDALSLNPSTFQLRVSLDLEQRTFAIRVVPSAAHEALANVVGHLYEVLCADLGQIFEKVGSERFPIELGAGKRTNKEADWGLALHSDEDNAPPSFPFVGGFSETRPQLLQDTAIWMKRATTRAVLIAWYSPDKPTLTDPGALARQPEINFELFEREAPPRSHSSSDAYMARVAAGTDYVSAWTRTWAFSDISPPALTFQLKHFIPEEVLPQERTLLDEVDLSAWAPSILHHLNRGARDWRKRKGVPNA